VVAVIESVEYKFHAGRDTKFLKNPEEILFDGVLAESQFLGDLAIGKSLSHQGYYLLLPGSHQHFPIGVHDTQRWHSGNHVDEELDLLGGGPGLAAVHLGGKQLRARTSLAGRPLSSDDRVVPTISRDQNTISGTR